MIRLGEPYPVSRTHQSISQHEQYYPQRSHIGIRYFTMEDRPLKTVGKRQSSVARGCLVRVSSQARGWLKPFKNVVHKPLGHYGELIPE